MSDSLPRPLIGITTRLDVTKNTFYLRRFYADAIADAGGAPLYIPLTEDREILLAQAARLDGLMLSGSDSDLDPVLYGEEARPQLGSIVPARDTTDLVLLEYAEEHRLPVLAICFGLQSLNVSRGGTLYQDIASQVPNALKHERSSPDDHLSHRITIEADSTLAILADGTVARVNSTHHQAVKEVGRDLRVTARTSDGVIEAVEDTRSDHFVLGLQWHPEVGWERDALSQKIFKAFLAAARD